GATDGRGGINPIQVGLGSQLGSIDNVHTQGFRETTNIPLDLQLEGDGMFVLEADNATYYTRAGNFYLDDEGFIVNPDGYYLLRVDVGENDEERIQIPDDAKSYSIQTDGTVNFVDQNNEQQVAGRIAIASFSNPSGLEKAGSNLFLNSPNAGYIGVVAPETEGTASIISGALEMSNVDLAEEFTEMIVAQRGFQANTRIIAKSDEILQELVNLKR